MLEVLSYTFFQNALIAALLASIACGVIGVYVVIKRIVFISGGISHSSFGGLGIAYYLGAEPLLGALIFAIASALGIGFLSKKSSERDDTVIGAVWAIGMAIGILFIAMTPGYAADLFSYLFGNILMVSSGHLLIMFVLDIIILASIGLFYNVFRAVAFDEEFAKTVGIPVFALNMFLLSLVALTVVIMIKAVGIILLIALLTLPAATANKMTKDMKRMMVLATFLGIIYSSAGIFISYFFDLPSGAMIILISAIGYLIATAKTFQR
ncbi:MAG: metal ABC transporter permease [Candidatus Micrarchaeota archaeon]|nr:metal ABC transporter permease [Candidatus Micrarchaeota archaeon]